MDHKAITYTYDFLLPLPIHFSPTLNQNFSYVQFLPGKMSQNFIPER